MDHMPGVSMSRHDNNDDLSNSEDEEMEDTEDVGDFDAKMTESQVNRMKKIISVLGAP